MSARRFAVIGACLLLLAGCAAEPPVQDDRALVLALAEVERDAGHEEQAALLEDGVASAEDYDEAFRLMRGCMEEGGVTLTEPVVSPADGLRYIWDFDANGLAPEAIDELQLECESVYWTSVSAAYPDTHAHVMDEPLRLAAIECLRAEGYELSGEERNFVELAGDPEADGGVRREAAADCVFREAHELYPELPSLSLTG